MSVAAPVQAPEQLLDGLDAQQRLVATTLHGPVCVRAGAGTGKTRAITHRIAFGVATGVYPARRVLALTFTARAADELRTRLRRLGADGVAARTFHAAALAQLNHFWPQVLGGATPQILESKARLVAQAAEVLRLGIDASGIRDLAAEIEFRKVSCLSLDAYAALGRPVPGGLRADQALRVHELYETLKDERRMLDFEDVLLATTGMLLSEPRVAAEVREQYKHFVVDEYQDVSPAQDGLLRAWLGGRDDVCVVGDPSQTIYSFAGASADYLLTFGRRYPGAKQLSLEQNYRSVPGVVEAANRLMARSRGALTLVAHREPEPAPACTLVRYDSEVDEAAGVATRIAALLAAGTPADAIAVLLRINGQSAELETALAAAGVPVGTRGTPRFFEQPVVRQAVQLLRAASIAVGDEPLFRSVADVLRELGHTEQAPDGPGERRTRWELLDALARLADEAPHGTTLREFVADIAERQASQHGPTLQTVTISTLHAAKGLEWDHVFLVGFTEGLLPIAYASSEEEIEEERRLLYVGVTRARRRLQVSWAATARGGERRLSRFAEDLRAPRAA